MIRIPDGLGVPHYLDHNIVISDAHDNFVGQSTVRELSPRPRSLMPTCGMGRRDRMFKGIPTSVCLD